MPNALISFALAVALLASAGATDADAHAPLATSAIRTLDQVPLRAAVKDALPEQWEKRPTEGDGVRNVVNPTLTLVLPAQDKANGLAVIIAPGGGFMSLAYDNEGMRVARHLAGQGIAAFVLKYRLNPTPRGTREYQAFLSKAFSGEGRDARGITTPDEAVEDGQAAVRLVRANARQWGVDPAKVGLIGFSAGAMTALAVGLDADRASRPDFIAPIYGPRAAGEVPNDAPPMFMAIALDDPLFNAKATIELIEGWQAAGRPYEAHLYERGGHGFGMTPRSEATKQWIGQFIAWMKDRGLFFGREERLAYRINNATIGSLLDDPDARTVLERHMPEFAANPQIGMARGLTLNQLHAFAPQTLSKEKLSAIASELKALDDKDE